jgi:hypothetical protein
VLSGRGSVEEVSTNESSMEDDDSPENASTDEDSVENEVLAREVSTSEDSIEDGSSVDEVPSDEDSVDVEGNSVAEDINNGLVIIELSLAENDVSLRVDSIGEMRLVEEVSAVVVNMVLGIFEIMDDAFGGKSQYKIPIK